MLRRKSGSRDAPRELVKLVANWKRLEAPKSATKRCFKEFRQEHHEILKRHASFARRVVKLGNQIHTARREVGLFTHRDVIMPILHRNRHRLLMRQSFCGNPLVMDTEWRQPLSLLSIRVERVWCVI